MRYLYLFLLIWGIVACAELEKAEIIVKDHYYFEHYPPRLFAESEYLLVGMADEIKSDSCLKNGDWHFTVDVKNPDGEYFSLLDMVIYLKPGSKLYLAHNERNRHESVFEGDCVAENKWINQRLLRGGNMLYEYDFNRDRQFVPFESYKTNIDFVADTLLKGMEGKGLTPAFVENMKERMTIMKAHAYLSYVGREIDTRRYSGNFSDDTSFAAWKNEQVELFAPVVLQNVFELLSSFPEEKVIGMKQGIDLLLSLEREYPGSLQKLGFTHFSELYQYFAEKQFDSAFAYSSELKPYIDKLTDERLRSGLLKIWEANKDLLEGSMMQDFEFEDVKGNKHRLSDFKGTPMYIDVWATWCNPCIALSPNFAALAKEYQGKDIKFIAISIDNKVQPWQKFLEKKGLPENVEEWHFLDKKFIETYRLTSIPRLMLVDKDFRIKTVFAPKPIGDMSEIKGMLDDLLED